MHKTISQIFDWSEVWALLIPLFALFFRRKQPVYMKPVIFYLWIALFLNLTGDIIGDYKRYLPHWLHSNNILYNIHSLVRFACFGYFFRLDGKTYRGIIGRIINLAAVFFILYNFIYVEDFTNPNHLSGNLLATEAFVLLIYCMQYYLSRLNAEVGEFAGRKDFWMVTGLCIYLVVNFFVFLFYVPMLSENPEMADQMWLVHNIAYISLCIFIAKSFYVPA